MKFWIVSMECADIVEAGGVKNVTYSLCKELSNLNHKVTLFLPVFKCNSWSLITNLKDFQETQVEICSKTETVSFSTAQCTQGNFNIVFIKHPSFFEKEAVYTYTEVEQIKNPEFVKGTGHKDALFLDILFQKSVCAFGKLISKSEIPDIVHCQDASCATLPALLLQNKLYKKVKSVVTIHNAGPAYHHNFSSIGEAVWYTSLDQQLLENSMNRETVEPFLLAHNSGAYLTTVSQDYANELVDINNAELTDGLAPIFAKKSITIKGITNGFDFERYNPEVKEQSNLPFEFSPEKNDLDGKLKCRKFFIQNIVNTDNFDSTGIKKYGKLDCSGEYTKEIYIAYHGRITTQKGLIVLIQAIPSILQNYNNVRFVIAGQGEQPLENHIINLTNEYAGKVTFMNGYNKVIARLSTAICDFIVLPSFFEPCGLEDYIAQVFGTIPIAHKTGGLNKIINEKTGFLYENNTAGSLIAKLSQVIMIKELKPSVINKMIKNAANNVRKEYLWKNVIQKKYIPFFKEIIKNI